MPENKRVTVLARQAKPGDVIVLHKVEDLMSGKRALLNGNIVEKVDLRRLNAVVTTNGGEVQFRLDAELDVYRSVPTQAEKDAADASAKAAIIAEYVNSQRKLAESDPMAFAIEKLTVKGNSSPSYALRWYASDIASFEAKVGYARQFIAMIDERGISVADAIGILVDELRKGVMRWARSPMGSTNPSSNLVEMAQAQTAAEVLEGWQLQHVMAITKKK